MTIEAEVNTEGILKTKVPDRFRGQRVRIATPEIPEQRPSQWAQIARVLERIDAVNTPHRSHDEILRELRMPREAGARSTGRKLHEPNDHGTRRATPDDEMPSRPS